MYCFAVLKQCKIVTYGTFCIHNQAPAVVDLLLYLVT